MLPLDIDPKLAWALKHRDSFPVDVNRAPREMLLRVPGLGDEGGRPHPRSRAAGASCGSTTLARLRVSIAKVRPFIVTADWRPTAADRPRRPAKRWSRPGAKQLELFAA